MILSNILVSIILNIYIIKGDDCEYSTPIGILDLRTLGYEDRPKYTDIHDTVSNTLTYSFNGCFSYSTRDTCQNAAACVTDETLKTSRLIARQAGRTFAYNQGLTTMIFTDGSGTTVRVFLVYKTTESSQASGVTDRDFVINIESKCACPGQCIYTPDKPSSDLSVGAVFIIILIGIIVTYLIVSVLILRFVKHEQGVNLIPNRTLWLQIGTDSIGGLRFILSKLTGRNTYENIENK